MYLLHFTHSGKSYFAYSGKPCFSHSGRLSSHTPTNRASHTLANCASHAPANRTSRTLANCCGYSLLPLSSSESSATNFVLARPDCMQGNSINITKRQPKEIPHPEPQRLEEIHVDALSLSKREASSPASRAALIPGIGEKIKICDQVRTTITYFFTKR